MPTSTDPSELDGALKGLIGLGLPKKYALSLLQSLPSNTGQDVNALLSAALQAHGRSHKASMSAASGGPQGAVPLKEPIAPAPGPQAPQSAPESTSMASRLAPAMPPPKKAPLPGTQEIKAENPKSGSQLAPAPPMSSRKGAAPELLQSFTEKPRVRVRAAGHRIPPAPLGGAPPTSAPPAPAQKPPEIVGISTPEEYEKLAPGTEFHWPDGIIYEKPAVEARA